MRILVPVLALLAGLTACADPGSAFRDDAACPGKSCTEDAQEQYDAVAAVEDVTAVGSVSRSYGLDRGAARSAEVSGAVETSAEATDLGIKVLQVLQAWPEAEAGDAVVTVTADPSVSVRGVESETRALTPDFFDPCRPAECRDAVADLEQAVAALDGVTRVRTVLDADRLRLDVTSDRSALPTRTAVLDLVETGLDLRVAGEVRVVVEHTGPLIVTLRLADGLVCEQPAGTVIACTPENAIPLLSPSP